MPSPDSSLRAVPFSTTRLAGEVTYDGRDRVINLIVGSVPRSFGVTRQFALWEWVEVLGDSGRLESAQPSPTTANRVKTEVKQLGDVFREYVDRIVAAGPTVIQQLEAARGRRQAEWRAEHAKWEHDSGAARAAEAFRAGDYRRVVCLLESLGDRLTPRSRKNLRSRVSGQRRPEGRQRTDSAYASSRVTSIRLPDHTARSVCRA